MKLKNIFDRQGLNRALEQLSFFIGGIIVGILFLKGLSFEIDPTFSLIDFLTLLVAFLLTFTLQHTLSSRADDDRIEKDLIIEGVRRIAANIDLIGRTCSASVRGELSGNDAKVVLGQFRDLNNELHALEPMLNLTPIKMDLNAFKQIKGETRALKKLVTGESFPASPLGLAKNLAIQAAVRALHASCVRFTFYVNRL